MNIVNDSFNYFSKTISETCHKSVGKDLSELSYEIFQYKHDNKKNFNNHIYEFLKSSRKEIKTDYYERVLKVLLKSGYFNNEKFIKYFEDWEQTYYNSNYLGFSHLQSTTVVGMKKILEIFHPNFDIAVIDKTNKQPFENFFNTKEQDYKCFILKHIKHYVAILIKLDKTNNEASIYITESLDPTHPPAQKVRECLLELIKISELKQDKIKLYYLTSGRQKRGFGCDVFAIRDAIQCLKNPEAVIKIANESKEANITTIKIQQNCKIIECEQYFFSTVPKIFNKLIQSLKDLQLETDGKEIERNLNEKGKIACLESGVEINLKVDLLLKKYTLGLIMKENLLDEAVSEIS